MKILIVAGGTGGHLYPGIAVARALSGQEVSFCVRRGDLGRGILAKEGFAVQEIAGQGAPRTLSWKVLTFPFHLVRGLMEARKLLERLHPDAVLAMGGYLSVPVVYQAKRLGIPVLLHEQNVIPGLANRVCRRWAKSIAVSFPESVGRIGGPNVWVSGLPIRPEIGSIARADGCRQWGLNPEIPTYFIFGGSLGAQRLNTLALEAWRLLLKEGARFQILHVTGPKDFDRVQAAYRTITAPAKVMAYCHEMAHAYAAASAVVCRSGASTVAELLACGRPALLVPYPHASNNHQFFNAQVLQNAGLGRVVLDAALTAEGIADFLKSTPPTSAKGPVTNIQQAAARLARSLTTGCS